MKKISCVIAAYNEGKRIGGVLDAIENHPLIDEVIVVDDGSKDDTSAVVSKRKNITLITLPQNKGKSFAVVTGIRKAKYDYLLTLDADLIGLRADEVSRLIRPVLDGEAEMAISLRKNSLPIMRLMGLDYVSGERVFKKSIIEKHLDEIEKLPSFAIESYINRLIINNAHTIKVVKWNSAITPRKSAKVGFLKGIWGDIKMIRDILRLVSMGEIVRQNYKMHKLKVKSPNR